MGHPLAGESGPVGGSWSSGEGVEGPVAVGYIVTVWGGMVAGLKEGLQHEPVDHYCQTHKPQPHILIPHFLLRSSGAEKTRPRDLVEVVRSRGRSGSRPGHETRHLETSRDTSAKGSRHLEMVRQKSRLLMKIFHWLCCADICVRQR